MKKGQEKRGKCERKRRRREQKENGNFKLKR
jgi:hypothetical protein